MTTLLASANLTMIVAVIAMIMNAIIITLLGRTLLRSMDNSKENSARHDRERAQAHERFQRDLDSLARKAANDTDESFPAVVRAEIDKHIDHMNQMRDRHTQESTDKLAWKDTPNE